MPKFRSSRGVWLNYEVAGTEEADVLILLHANPFDSRMWLYQMAHLSQYFRVIALDFPGYGKSDPISDKTISISDMAKDVWPLLGGQGADVAIVIGLSVGSRVALQFTLDYQPHVKALILAGCGAGTTTRSRMEERIQGYRQWGLSYRRQHIESLVTREFASSELGQHLISLFLETNATTDIESIVCIFQALAEYNITDKLHEIKVPTLAISGEEDSTLSGSLELSRAIGGSEHRIIKGAGHACAMEKPWEFDALALGFLRKHNLPSAVNNSNISTPK